MEQDLRATITTWLVQNLEYSAPYYGINLISELSAKITWFATLGTYAYKDMFLPEDVLEIALEDFETEMRNMLMSNPSGERHYFAKDVLMNWELVSKKVEEVFRMGVGM